MPNLRRGTKEPIRKPTVKKAFAGDLDADTIILNLSAMGYVLMILHGNNE